MINNTTNWKHRHLDHNARQNFIKLYKESEHRAPLFMFMKHSSLTQTIWIVLVLLCEIFMIYWSYEHSIYSILRNFILMIGGLLYLQIYFVATHIEAHSKFLEYDNHIPGNKRCTYLPVYYYAFYHHHHFEKDNHDNWAPQLSYHNTDGLRSILTAHWYSYTKLASQEMILLAVMAYLCPSSCMLLFGYELGVFLLPIANGYQHVKEEEFGILRLPVRYLARMNIIANKREHKGHHIHNHPTVYQDFSPSGIYMNSIDKFVNSMWDYLYYKAIKKGCSPNDTIYPYTISVIRIMQAIGLFIFVCLFDPI